jgi:alkanesulfonate monooxygenase SsuD/methylene tetrahydromethanopterin reductase-like flavin-dependent oxidoreductase (luciferase family)
MERIDFGVRLSLLPEYFEKHDFEVIKRYACLCEELSFSSLWVMDQLLWGQGGPFECWVALGALASVTKRIRLGPYVNCTSYRNPALLAKMAATLDRISNGRLEFGIGAGWDKKEFDAYGIPFLDNRTRIDQMKEAILIVKKMWTEEKPSYNGTYFRISEAVCEPRPVQEPYPPILVGGESEPSLRVSAMMADKCNFLHGSFRNYKRKLNVLKMLCKEVDRDFDEITKIWHGDIIVDDDRRSVLNKVEKFKPSDISLDQYLDLNIVGSTEECLAKLRRYVQLGVTYFIPSLRTIKDDLQTFSESVVRAMN